MSPMITTSETSGSRCPVQSFVLSKPTPTSTKRRLVRNLSGLSFDINQMLDDDDSMLPVNLDHSAKFITAVHAFVAGGARLYMVTADMSEGYRRLHWGPVHLSIGSKLALTDGIPHHSINTIRCVDQHHYVHPPSLAIWYCWWYTLTQVYLFTTSTGWLGLQKDVYPIFLHSPQNQLHRHHWSLPLRLCTQQNPKKLIILWLLFSQPHPHWSRELNPSLRKDPQTPHLSTNAGPPTKWSVIHSHQSLDTPMFRYPMNFAYYQTSTRKSFVLNPCMCRHHCLATPTLYSCLVQYRLARKQTDTVPPPVAPASLHPTHEETEKAHNPPDQPILPAVQLSSLNKTTTTAELLPNVGTHTLRAVVPPRSRTHVPTRTLLTVPPMELPHQLFFPHSQPPSRYYSHLPFPLLPHSCSCILLW